MRKPKWLDMHVILGALVGFLISYFVNIECWWFYWYLESVNKLGNLTEYTFGLVNKTLTIIIFIIIFLAFNNKKARKFNFNKISISIIVFMAVSAAITMVVFMIFVLIFVNPIYLTEPINIFVINMITVFSILGSIVTFIGMFLLLISSRVKYIKYLTHEVKKLETNGFGTTIEVKGQDELAELCTSINAMSLELKSRIDNERLLEKNRTELITNVSHDLRTPLTSIMGYIDLIKTGNYENQETLNEYVSIIDSKTKNLNKLINELFEYTKLTNNDIKLNYDSIDITSLCEQLMGEYLYIFHKEGLALTTDIPSKEILLNIDIEKIVRVLDNLLSNAIKYAQDNSTINLKLFDNNEEVYISLSNKTNEINEDNINNLFERFYKYDMSRSENESSGLGLSIAKRIIELHGGSIESTLIGDTITFTITLYK